ncbi:MAG: hypothetical protein HY647_02585, partial [Acidobacteria bacterium]|nr:hypothetical protein [Acidobacteriota bacterium]
MWEKHNSTGFFVLKGRGKTAKASILWLFWLLIPIASSGQFQPIPEKGFVNGQAARFVLGQRNLSDISFCDPLPEDPGKCPTPTAARVGAVSSIAVTGNRLMLADSSFLSPPNNNRVLIYNDLAALKARRPQDELPPANVVLGQPDFASATAGTAADRMNQPVGVATDGTRLFVAEWGNNRVLIYNQIPESSGAAADVVVGQSNFTSSTAALGPRGLTRPSGVWSDGTRLFIADTLNNRVLIFQRIPAANGADADIVLGQLNFDTSGAIDPITRCPRPAANIFCNPTSVTTDGQRLIVTDLGNNRVLIYNRIPTENGATPNVVVGQPDLTSRTPGNTETKLNFPRSAYSDGTRLLIADSGNNRILIYNQIPTQNGEAPDIVLGQEDFLGILESCAASNFAVPYALASDGELLYVSDSLNRRVLGFRPGPVLVPRNSVVNGASFSPEPQTAACAVILPQPPVAPGGIASIFGTDLAETPAQADSLPLPTELGGVRVRFNGIEAPLFYVSPRQINVQVPFELTGFSASMEIEKRTSSGTVLSAAMPIGLANGAPGIFTMDGSGQGPGLILHADFSPVTPDSPAKKGETLIAFVTGLGTVDHEVTNGAGAEFATMGTVSLTNVPREGDTVTITINGRDYTYTAAAGDGPDVVMNKLVELIRDNDPEVTAFADLSEIRVQLRARVFGDQGTNIAYSASTSEGAAILAEAGEGDVLPGGVTLRGVPEPGQTVTITLAETPYSYTTSAGDTVQTIVARLAELINNDPNVQATSDLQNSRIGLELRDPSQGQTISYAASVSPETGLTAVLDKQHLKPGVANATNTVSATIGRALPLVPGDILIGGTPQPGQTVTITLQDTPYSYTTAEGDTLQTVVSKL